MSNTSPVSCSPDTVPAHALWVQLATRIATQSLHYRSGEEERAAWSLFLLFEKTRQLLEAHPQALEFRAIAVSLLNNTLRPYTDRWSGWMTEDKEKLTSDGKPVHHFHDEQVRRQFRAELGHLQDDLRKIQKKLAQLAGVKDIPAETKSPIAKLGDTLRAGIGTQVQVKVKKPAEEGAQNIPKPRSGLVDVAEINAVEQEDIVRRRIALGGSHLQPGDSPSTAEAFKLLPTADESVEQRAEQIVANNTAGLALSGGGIRSATFCLGVVQVMAREGLLTRFDYLSTVSGGGYLGSFLSYSLGTKLPGDTSPTTQETAQARIDDVFLRQDEKSRQQGIESGLVRHLRNNSKYLLHGGFLGKAWMLWLMLSGFLWNVMIMLPLPLALALGAYAGQDWLWSGTMGPGRLTWGTMWETRAGYLLWTFAVVLAATWMTLPGVQLLTHGSKPKSARYVWRQSWEKGSLILVLATLAAGLVFLVPAFFRLPEWSREVLSGRSIAGFNLETFAKPLPAWITGMAGAALAAVTAWLTPKWPRIRSLAVKLLILTGPLLLLFVFLLVGNRMGLGRDGQVWSHHSVLFATAVLVAWNWVCVNINTLSPHSYYRNRLCDCYLARRSPEAGSWKRSLLKTLVGSKAQGKTEVLQQVRLSDLGQDLTAPCHILNMTVNVPGSGNKELRGRGGDFFLASRRFCGSPLTGYARTEDVERVDPHFDLGTAMAVSAAAASTNMGWQTLPHLRFLMTIFNIRLGYWLRNPASLPLNRYLSGAGPLCLFWEMLGTMDENYRHVNLSDGGHIENLGAYELLRRRCKFIVCVDCGHEPRMECSDLMRLQRCAEIDLGLRMHFDISDLQIGPNGLSRAHAILVKIDYAPDLEAHGHGRATSKKLGWMLYLKLAMTGVEPNHVKDYHRQHPEFPHQSTGDQIYEEDQFEAYRSLGECAMEGMLRKEIVGETKPSDMHSWFQSLANKLLRDNDEAFG